VGVTVHATVNSDSPTTCIISQFHLKNSRSTNARYIIHLTANTVYKLASSCNEIFAVLSMFRWHIYAF